MTFEFATASRIIFGRGKTAEVPDLVREMEGSKVFLVTGRTNQRVLSLLDQLTEKGLQISTYNVAKEPTTDIVIEGVSQARRMQSSMVIGIGGGSVIDTGKAIAALLRNSGELLDYLEVIGKGQPLQSKPAPFIAIPTTAGTGTEVTRNAVIKSSSDQVKVSMRSALMIPDIAVIDPELTYSLPPELTASTGLDALTQLIEAFVSKKANPLTDGICREGLPRAGRSLQKAYKDGNNKEAREDMALASLFSGFALANAGLGAVHGFAGPLGGMFPAPHGIICARLLPHVIEANLQALEERSPDSRVISRFQETAKMLTGLASATALDGLHWIQELCSALKVPSLKRFGLQEDNFSTVIEKAKKASSMKGNPIELTTNELEAILRKAAG